MSRILLNSPRSLFLPGLDDVFFPVVACLNRAYKASLSSLDGDEASCWTAAAAALNRASEGGAAHRAGEQCIARTAILGCKRATERKQIDSIVNGVP